jgi:hypothetical protein
MGPLIRNGREQFGQHLERLGRALKKNVRVFAIQEPNGQADLL